MALYGLGNSCRPLANTMHASSMIIMSSHGCWLQGDTQVALYGLGNAREERLVRCFMTPGQVDWCEPRPSSARCRLHCDDLMASH